MAIHQTYSSRKKALLGELPDVYIYEPISKKLKNQICNIIEGSIGTDYRQSTKCYQIYVNIIQILTQEHGLRSMHQYGNTPSEILITYFLENEKTDECLDIIELCFAEIDTTVRDNLTLFVMYSGFWQAADDAIQELNDRFKNAGLGYQYSSGQIMRIDSQLIHTEVVKSLLFKLANEPLYAGANQEYIAAHEHYRHDRLKESIVFCGKSFESLMKAISNKRSWSVVPNANAKQLINACISNNLIPGYLQEQFTFFKELLLTGTPVVRNKIGAHGQGVEVVETPEYLASYVLHLTATNLLFLVDCEKSLP